MVRKKEKERKQKLNGQVVQDLDLELSGRTRKPKKIAMWYGDL